MTVKINDTMVKIDWIEIKLIERTNLMVDFEG